MSRRLRMLETKLLRSTAPRLRAMFCQSLILLSFAISEGAPLRGAVIRGSEGLEPLVFFHNGAGIASNKGKFYIVKGRSIIKLKSFAIQENHLYWPFALYSPGVAVFEDAAFDRTSVVLLSQKTTSRVLSLPQDYTAFAASSDLKVVGGRLAPGDVSIPFVWKKGHLEDLRMPE